MKQLIAVVALGALMVPTLAGAQAVAERQGETARRPVTGDAGVSSMTVMNREAFRVLRDFFEPGAVRRMHSHQASYHVLMAITGRLRVTVEGNEPVDVSQGEVLQLEAGAAHSIENIGDVTATIVEVFGKE